MNREAIIQDKITSYQPKGGLVHSSRLFLALAGLNHKSTKAHVENVALLSEAVAKALKKDAKAAFFAGLLHDIAKVTLPSPLFDGHNISTEEVPVLIWHSIVSHVKDMLVTKESPSVYQLFLKPQELNWKRCQAVNLIDIRRK
jgi:response regulator RpfG family c-di-GMP phosphodiesterase